MSLSQCLLFSSAKVFIQPWDEGDNGLTYYEYHIEIVNVLFVLTNINQRCCICENCFQVGSKYINIILYYFYKILMFDYICEMLCAYLGLDGLGVCHRVHYKLLQHIDSLVDILF